jgi:hypothetical protein
MQVQAAVAALPLVAQPDGASARNESSTFSELLRQSTRAELSPQGGLDANGGRRQVNAVRTPLSAEQAKQALGQAWEKLYGEPPSPGTLGILTAQWAHETASGDRMFNYNFGGIKGHGPSGLTVAQSTREGSGKDQVRIVDNFRAYRSAEEGATDYLALLQRRYGSALEAAQSSDPVGFVRELKSGGYFTGDERLYARSIVRLAERAVGPDVLQLGPGGALPSAEALLQPSRRAAVSGEGFSMHPGALASNDFDPSVVSSLQVDVILDEMSRSALRLLSQSDGGLRRTRSAG